MLCKKAFLKMSLIIKYKTLIFNRMLLDHNEGYSG